MVCAVLICPRPWQVGQGSHNTRVRLSRVRLRVISTRPSEVKPLMVMRVRSRARALDNSASTAALCS